MYHRKLLGFPQGRQPFKRPMQRKKPIERNLLAFPFLDAPGKLAPYLVKMRVTRSRDQSQPVSAPSNIDDYQPLIGRHRC